MAYSEPCIIQIPYEEGCYWRKGCKEGVKAIVEQMHKIREYSIESKQLLKWNMEDLIQQPLELNPYNKKECLEKIYHSILESLENGKVPISIGGDHSISFPILKAIDDYYKGKEIYILQFDAHSDTFNDVGGYKHHHGATFKNVVEQTNISGKNIFQFGIRGYVRKDSFQFAEENGINVISIKQFTKQNCQLENYNLPKDAYYYISIDIDSVDPAFAPGTGTPVPGGLTSNQILDIVNQLSGYKVIGVDLVEVAPNYDYSNITSLLAAHIMMDILVSCKFYQI